MSLPGECYGLDSRDDQASGSRRLSKFFADHRQLYLDKALKAHQYASDYVQGSGEKVRVDDVAAPLVLALKVGDPLSDFLAGKKLTQKYWYERFADYILDQLWEVVQR